MSLAVMPLDRPREAPFGSSPRAPSPVREAPSGLDQRLRALAQGHGFYSGLYLHIGHVLCDAERVLATGRLVASSAVALRQYGAALAASSVARRAATAHRPFAWSSVEERFPGLVGRHIGLSIPVQDHAAGPGVVTLVGQDYHRARALAADAAGVLAVAATDLHQSALAGMRPAAIANSALTAREIECLRSAATGQTVAETAEGLGIASRTVEFHLKNVTEKLGAANKVHAVAIAVSHGLFTLRN